MSSELERLFTFYGLVSLSVKAPPSITNFLHSEWQPFEVSVDGVDPDFAVTWTQRHRSRRDAALHIPKNLSAGWYKGCFWQATTATENGRVYIEYSSIPRSRYLFRDSCLEPLVLSSLESKGFHTLHASSLLIGGKAWAFCGRPRSGKTVLALMGTQRGHTLLSDDVAILESGRVYPYPVPARIYLHNYRQRELFEGLISPEVTREFVLNLIISATSLGTVRIPTRLFFPHTAPTFSSKLKDPYPLGGLFLLMRRNKTPSVEPCRDKTSAVKEVAGSLPPHGAAVTKPTKSQYVGGDGPWQSLDSTIGNLVEEGNAFEINIPNKPTVEEWKRIFDMVLEVTSHD